MRMLYYCLLIVIALAQRTYGQASMLAGSFWYLAEASPRDNTKMNSEDYTQVAEAELEEEAQYVFSGMLHGYWYSYTPNDPTRKIPEKIELVPRASISKDADIQQSAMRIDAGTAHVTLRYDVKPEERIYQRAWESVYTRSEGQGSGELKDGLKGKIAAIEDAMREGLLIYLRQNLANRPRQVQGSILLHQVPRIIVDSGEYRAFVRVRIRIRSYQDFTVF